MKYQKFLSIFLLLTLASCSTNEDSSFVIISESSSSITSSETSFSESISSSSSSIYVPNFDEPVYIWEEDYSKVKAIRVDNNNVENVEEEEVETTSEIILAATCLEDGTIRYTTKEFSNPAFTEQYKDITINAINHDFDEPTYVFNNDYTEVTATAVCKNDPSHIVTETVDVTSDVIVQATCTVKKVIRYTSNNFTNSLFTTQVKEVTYEALNHDYDEPTYQLNASKNEVTARAVCKNDPSHVVEETVSVSNSLTKPAKCSVSGKRTYTSEEFTNPLFTTYIYIEDIQMLDHDYGDYSYLDEEKHIHTCNECGHIEEENHNYKILSKSDIIEYATFDDHSQLILGTAKYTCVECGHTKIDTHDIHVIDIPLP